uniref:VWFD domain-containing protein n=1 Tax=Taeniopygia guttata TaxID=59729 RepID=A0A674HN93_TAEGU
MDCQCGCWHNGQHYPVGSEFWTDDTCSSKCTCPARGSQVQCFNASCPAGQYCGVQNGKPVCLEHSYGICHVHGDPHYKTFDKVTHNFMGNCTYTLAKVCSNSTSLPYFNVEAKNEQLFAVPGLAAAFPGQEQPGRLGQARGPQWCVCRR